MTLAEISEAAGLPARTVRFYIARGLLAGPVKSGRDASYTADHVARLKQIQTWQSEGKSLSEISRLVAGEVAVEIAPSAWWQYAVGEDVTVSVKAGLSPWRMKQVQAALKEFAAKISERGEK